MISIKSKSEISIMKQAGQLLAETLCELENKVKPGISTLELDVFAEAYIRKHNGKPAFKGVKMPGTIDFPGTLCTSVNEGVVHGIPSQNVILKEGDILSVDCGVYLNGYYSDAARTFGIGKVSSQAQTLIDATRESFFEGTKAAVEGNRIYDISAAIEDYIGNYGFSIVRTLIGHGIGTELWEDPQIPNYRTISKGPRIRNGMALAIEPMINIGDYHVKTLKDGWTVVTEDGSLSAHYENTVIVTENGPEIITLIK